MKESAFVSVWVLGTTLLKNLELPNLSEIVFADKVIGFRAGGEAIKGANKHGDPAQVLGDVTAKPDDAFVSLGAYGELAVAVPRLPSDPHEITVFVRPDVDLRAYRVEVTTSSPTDGKGLTFTTVNDKVVNVTRLAVEEFVANLRERKRPRCSIEEGFNSAVTCHLGTKSYLENRPIRWDREKEEAVAV